MSEFPRTLQQVHLKLLVIQQSTKLSMCPLEILPFMACVNVLRQRSFSTLHPTFLDCSRHAWPSFSHDPGSPEKKTACDPRPDSAKHSPEKQRKAVNIDLVFDLSGEMCRSKDSEHILTLGRQGFGIKSHKVLVMFLLNPCQGSVYPLG